MKTFLTKHKVLLIALSGVLCLGVLSGLVLTGVIRFSKEGKTFATVAEAKEEQNKTTSAENGSAEELTNPVPTPSPVPEEEKLSPDMIRTITEEVQRRRQYAIPIRTGYCNADNKMFWDQYTASAEEENLARQAAEEYTQILYGKSYEELTGYSLEAASVVLYTDKDGDRDAFLRVTDPAGAYIVTVRETDWKLLCADLLTYPETVTIDREKDALRLAEKLGYKSAVLYRDNNNQWMHEGVYMLTTDTDECLAFSYCGDQLWQFAVYPNQETMLECEYFLADMQFDYETPAYPRNFAEAEAPAFGEDQMVGDRKITSLLYRLYNQLSGEEAKKQEDFKATFYRDDSGAREDCWVITGDRFEMTVSAYSRDVIRLDCVIPCKDLLDIPYDDMGGAEYEAVVRQIGENLFTALGTYDGDTHGKAVKNVDVNAVADDHYCTMDVWLEDGTVYELGFEDGVLKYAEHYANDDFFWVGINTGWVADTVYVNAATGKQYVPEYRDWDGDLHIKPRPEN
ncbi:MAG: hypothetical protein IKP38_00220 [Clostridia bacterium]|nr:hypothetical protein [Clostridia bacterium]